ncbi:MAG: glycosyltransferase family 4 protein [Candidatus Promineifilaceae bacterium]
MSTSIVVFLVSLAVTGASVPFVRQMALTLGFVDVPAKRKLHSTPIPLMGGVAIFGGAILILVAYFGRLGNMRVLGLLFGATLVAIVGLIDDRKPLPPLVKLGGQSIAFVIVIALGTTVQLPVHPYINYTLTFVWLAVITNTVNFLDNMDGLCAGVCAVAAAFIVLMAELSGQFFVGPIAAAVLGACLGFLRYNFKPASIFMGDAGALFLGFLLAQMTLQLRFPANSTFVTWMIPLLLMGVPLFDLTLVVIARLRRGVNPLTTAGKDHTSHRLVRMGLSHREAVMTIYLMGGAFGMVALFVTHASTIEGYAVGGSTALFAGFLIYNLLQREDVTT